MEIALADVDAAKAAKACAISDYMRIDGDEDGFRRHLFSCLQILFQTIAAKCFLKFKIVLFLCLCLQELKLCIAILFVCIIIILKV